MGQATASSKQANTVSVNNLTDQVIAFDLLISAKTGVKLVAQALTEASTPDVRIMLHKHLGQAIVLQEQIAAYIADRCWYNAADLKAQLTVDAKKAQETLDLLK
jgi:similar to spore coat protein